MSNQDDNKPDFEQTQSATNTDASAAPNDLQDLVETIAGKLRFEERRHAGVLQHMQSRLAMLGAEAHIARYRVPQAYQPALENIKTGLKELSTRIAEAGSDALAPVPPISERTHNENVSEFDVMSEPDAPAALMSVVTEDDWTQSERGTDDVNAETDTFDVVSGSDFDDQDPSNPWDAASADALARIYESGDESNATLNTSLESEPLAELENPVDMSLDEQSPMLAAVEPTSVAPSEAPAAQQQWLEERFAEIASRIEGNSEPTAADIALDSLTERFDKLEDRFSSAMDDVATKADLGGLSIVEAHINEINTHLEETQSKFVKLDNIEAQLSTVMDRLSDDHLGDLANVGAQMSPQVVEEVAMAAAEKAAMKLSAIDQAAGPQDERMADLQNSLHNFMDERRQGEIESQTMMETMQQAMVRVLDRVDAIEMGGQSQHAVHPVMPQEPMAASAAFAQPEEPMAPYHGEAIAQSTVPTTEESAQIKGAADSFEARMQEIVAQQHTEAQVDFVQAAPEQAYEDPYPEVSSTEDLHTDGGIPAYHEAEVSFAKAEAGAPQSHLEQEPSPFDMAPGAIAEETTKSNFEVPPAPEMPAAQVSEFEAEPADDHDVPDADFDRMASSHSMVPPAPVPPRPQVSTSDSISKMRQDLIANAQKAKLQAAADAGRQMEEGKKKKKGLSLGLGFMKKSKEDEPAENGGEEETSKGGGLFGLTKRKLIVSMFIAICTVPAFAAMMETPIGASVLADIMHRTSISASGGVAVEVEPTAAHSDDVLNPEAVRPGVAPGPQHEDNGKRRTVELGDGYQGQIIDDVAEAEITATRLASNTPAGMTVYDSGRKITQGLISHFEKREDLAKRSAKLGKFAVPATPVSLSDEFNDVAHLDEMKKPIMTSNSRGARGLPPAKVGPLSLRLAAAKGDPSAQFQVGTRLAQGKGNPQDFRLAAEWFKRSAQQGFAQSQYRLGTLFERGLGVKKDTARAQAWYRRAADQGNLKSMHNMAVLSANPTKGRAPDYATAAQWFTKAADRGLSDSQFNLAVLYENGLGVQKNLQRAYKYFALAAKSGDVESSRRRDAVIALLEVEDLAQAEKLVKNFKRQRSDRLANDALAAGQSWKKNSTGANYVN